MGSLPLINPDIQGYAIRLSSFVAHLCVALLIACSIKPQRRFYLPLLSQVTLTILSVFLCRGRNQLSLSDIEFAIVQTQSPVSIYVLLLVIPRLFFQRPALNTKKDAIQHQVWSLVYVLGCLGLNLVRQFDKTGYPGFTQAARDTFSEPIITPSLIQLYGKVWLGLAVCSVLVYECVLHRHSGLRHEIMHQLAGKRKKSLKAWPSSKRIRWGFVATWFIATKLHPWLPFFYSSIMFLNWSRDMRIWSIEDDFRWTYGQLLSICQLIIILYPCWQLCNSRWREVAPLPRRLILDIIWLISGKGQPWADPTESDLILRDLWDAFPPEVTPEEIGLPTAISAPPLSVTNSFPADDTASIRSMHSRRRQNHTDRRSRSEHVSGLFLEEDIADQMPQSGLGPIITVGSEL